MIGFSDGADKAAGDSSAREDWEDDVHTAYLAIQVYGPPYAVDLEFSVGVETTQVTVNLILSSFSSLNTAVTSQLSATASTST
jgi:hypothetical protein